jgi:hypothetical protein
MSPALKRSGGDPASLAAAGESPVFRQMAALPDIDRFT